METQQPIDICYSRDLYDRDYDLAEDICAALKFLLRFHREFKDLVWTLKRDGIRSYTIWNGRGLPIAFGTHQLDKWNTVDKYRSIETLLRCRTRYIKKSEDEHRATNVPHVFVFGGVSEPGVDRDFVDTPHMFAKVFTMENCTELLRTLVEREQVEDGNRLETGGVICIGERQPTRPLRPQETPSCHLPMPILGGGTPFGRVWVRDAEGNDVGLLSKDPELMFRDGKWVMRLEYPPSIE